MFEGIKAEEAEEAEKQDDCMEFLKMYARFLQDIADPKVDRVRIAKFEIKVDNAWRMLAQEKQDIIVAALLRKKMLPEELALAIKHFKAKVISVA